MEKLIYLLGDSEPGTVPRDRADLRDALLETSPLLIDAGARKASFCVADLDETATERVPQFNVSGLHDAAVSLWLESLDQRKEVETLLSARTKRLASYLVTESVPLELAGGAPLPLERYPGFALVTTFPKPERLDDETFYSRWHGSHTKLSLEIHPLTQYIRNSVARPLTIGAPPLRAIVSDSVASVEILADPDAFYGSDEGRRRAVKDLLGFVDFEAMSSVLMSQYALGG